MEGTDLLTELKGVGEKNYKLLNKCHLTTVEELADYYPRTYEEYKSPISFHEMKEKEECAIAASVHSRMRVCMYGKRKVCLLQVKDMQNTIREIAWFNMPFLANVFKVHQKYIFVGQAVRKNGVLTLEHPKYFKVEEYQKIQDSLQPVYALTKGLTNAFLRKCITQLKPYFNRKLEYLEEAYLKKHELLPISEAYEKIHFPENEQQVVKARNRLVFHEMFQFFIRMENIKEKCGQAKNGYVIKKSPKVESLIKNLPYELTSAQKEAYCAILEDMMGETVMNRLLQGDVGSGKTIVAILSLLTVVDSGYQGAIMAPTEVLARQHYNEITALLNPYGVRVALLTGSVKGAQRKEILKNIASQEVDIVVGTHALIQSSVKYQNLALVITDEQHRFGVRQRTRLAEKSLSPHVLVMSATPIPRTLALMLYGDMSISVMKELPAKRLPIKNCVVGTSYRPSAFRFMQKEIALGHQAYIICPMVEESETTQVENVTEYSKMLSQAMPEAKIQMLHGKMKETEKNEIMQSFVCGEIDVLVSTTVIEVGINVPNATFMLIENAERFGLAQLHQLRGRVGRGEAQSYCVFMYGKESDKTKQRLEVLNQSNDGFYIASEDLKLRGPGDFLGIRQSGEMGFALTDIYQDAQMIALANEHYHKCKREGFDFSQFPDLCFEKEEFVTI